MSERRGFEVPPSQPSPGTVEPLGLDDLPVIPLFAPDRNRLPRGAWQFYNATGGLGTAWAWVVLVGGLALAIFSVAYSFTTRGSNDPSIWKVSAVEIGLACLAGFMCYRSYLRLRELCRVAVVVPARVDKVGGTFGANEVAVEFTF